MKNNVTIQGRIIGKMTNNDIVEYLGITDNENKKYVNDILKQAKEIEKEYKNKNVDYCLKNDYYSYVLDTNTEIVNETKDIVIYKQI